jgi:hypothetical protein
MTLGVPVDNGCSRAPLRARVRNAPPPLENIMHIFCCMRLSVAQSIGPNCRSNLDSTAGTHRFTSMCCGLAHRVLDVYAPVVGQSPAVDRRLSALMDVVCEELAVGGKDGVGRERCVALLQVELVGVGMWLDGREALAWAKDWDRQDSTSERCLMRISMSKCHYHPAHTHVGVHPAYVHPRLPGTTIGSLSGRFKPVVYSVGSPGLGLRGLYEVCRSQLPDGMNTGSVTRATSHVN